ELIDDRGAIRSVAVAHADPAKVELARELHRRWPADPKGVTGTAQVLRTGQAELYESIDRDLLSHATRDPEHLRIALELQLHSGLVVPIIARGKTIGAMTLAWAESRGRYTRDDVPLMEELCRRAGMAIDNSRLYLEAQNAVRLRDEFLSIASHELRTPLTSLQLQVSGVQRSVGKAASIDVQKLSQRVAVIDQQVGRLTSLVNGLLDVSRASAGRLRLDISDVDLASVVEDAAGRLRSDVEAAGCALTIDVDGSIVGRWDRLRLDQIVTNFLTNAMKYGAGTPIEISGTTKAGRALLSVRDHGIGIPVADQQRIFERFGRAVSAENYGGLGLGLWIAKECVEAMGGTVRVDSELGRGALFTIELPLVRAEEQPSVH
ncbi:MAG: Sensory box histidine kinase, partial [bacterium]|nr:Sensory box histidine kinase [bacterium]